MSLKSNLLKAGALGAAITALSIGAASAAVATASVNVRTGPSTSYRVVDTLSPGQYVRVVGESGGWCRVTSEGPDGWVSCAYLSDDHVRVRPFYRSAPSIGFSFGFGTPGPGYPYGMDPWPRHDDHHHHWHP